MSSRIRRARAYRRWAPMAALLASCQTDSEPARPTPSGSAEPPKIEVTCRAAQDLDPSQREAIEAAAHSAYETLVRRDFDALWAMLHPQARQGQQREPVVEALRSMRERLGTSPKDPQLEWLHFVDIEGGVNDLARVRCGATDSLDGLSMMANAGGEDLAAVSLWTPGTPYSYATTLTLRKRGATWRVVGVHVSPSAFEGKAAIDYFRAAETLSRKGNPVGAFLSLGVARSLSGRGSSVTTSLRDRIDDNLAEIESSRAFTSELGTWSIDGRTYAVHGFGLASTQTDLSAIVQYVAPGGLVRETLDSEADQLIAHVRTRYPELRTMFDAVVFEAYREPPTEKNREYDAYRIARYLDPSRAAPSSPGATASPPPQN